MMFKVRGTTETPVVELELIPGDGCVDLVAHVDGTRYYLLDFQDNGHVLACDAIINPPV